MRSTLVQALVVSWLAVSAASAKPARVPRADLAGIRPGMSEDAVHAQLARRGGASATDRDEREGNERRETWTFRRGPWGYVALAFGNGDAVRWVTAFARPTGRSRVRYDEIGPMDQAQRTGNVVYLWRVPPRAGAPAFTVIARGTDSLYVSSVSLAASKPEIDRASGAVPDSAR